MIDRDRIHATLLVFAEIHGRPEPSDGVVDAYEAQLGRMSPADFNAACLALQSGPAFPKPFDFLEAARSGRTPSPASDPDEVIPHAQAAEIIGQLTERAGAILTGAGRDRVRAGFARAAATVPTGRDTRTRQQVVADAQRTHRELMLAAQDAEVAAKVTVASAQGCHRCHGSGWRLEETAAGYAIAGGKVMSYQQARRCACRGGV